MEKSLFQDMALSTAIKNALAVKGFVEAFPIQAEAIPHLLQGRDLIGQAQTGTGKTLAFAIPTIEKIDPQHKKIQAVVLCPTRELAIQATHEFQQLLTFKSDVSVVSIYGGQPIQKQLTVLKKRPQIIIATPGRLQDHMARGTIRLQDVHTIVLDEADEMLNMGFRGDIETILGAIPGPRQTILFSATMPKAIRTLAEQYLSNPEFVKPAVQQMALPQIEQQYFKVPNNKGKSSVLKQLLTHHQFELSIVFCNTKRQVNDLVTHLQGAGFQTAGLHGGLRQSKRDHIMGRFRKRHIDVLVATDVAARGLDVDNVQAVFNYDLPIENEAYVHRIGRTGRAGQSGRAFTFVSDSQVFQLRRMMKAIGYPPAELTMQPLHAQQ
jgi:ATP-dependent RNA helicase DeaD